MSFCVCLMFLYYVTKSLLRLIVIIFSVYLYSGFNCRFHVFLMCLVALSPMWWFRDLVILICIFGISFVFNVIVFYCMSLCFVIELVFNLRHMFSLLVYSFLSRYIWFLLVLVVYVVWVLISFSVFQYIRCFHLLFRVDIKERSYILL